MAITATLSSANPPASVGTSLMTGLTKWRLPILLIVAFGGVVYVQYGHILALTAPDKSVAQVTPVESDAATLPKIQRSDLPPVNSIPAIQLSVALQHDPFAPTALLGQVSPVEIVTAPPLNRTVTTPIEDISVDVNLKQRFKNSPVRMIYQDSQGRKVALIGNRTIHVGDMVEGMRVLDITPTALIVETTNSPTP